jgi:fucose permease
MNSISNTSFEKAGRHLLDITSCLAFMVYAASVVAIPVCFLNMSKELGLDLTGGGVLELVRSLLLFVVLLIGGQATAYFGKQKMLSSGAWITAIGLLLFSFAHTYYMSIACIMLIGFGSGMLEALISPIVQDIHPDNPEKALNIINAFFPLGVLISSLLIGYFLTYGTDWRTIFRFLAATSAVIGILYYMGRKVALPRSKSSKKHIIDILKRPGFWWFGIAMVCAGAIEASFTFWSATFIRLRFHDIASLGAIATAIFATSMFIGRILTSFLVTYIGLRNMIKLSGILGIIVCLFIPITNSILSFEILLALAGLTTACLWPNLQALSVQELPVDPTLLMIFLSCFGIPGFGLAGWLIGFIGNFAGLAVGLSIVPIFFIILMITLWMELKNKKSFNKQKTNSAFEENGSFVKNSIN